ncbi:MAG TPA: tagatose 1,6-diphosphate aldolase [Acidobacteriaceae bacterium]|jgi:tagatose 1,6-diphosphate aldolase
MPLGEMTPLKRARMAKLTAPSGIIGALAIDQRRSLRRMIAGAAGVPFEQIADQQLVVFKEAISEILSPHATAILFDTEYGMEGASARASGCGLLLAYEADGYENPRPNRELALMPTLSVQRLADMGADGVKILLHYSPEDPTEANERKFAMIERIGAECEAVELPFFLEPVIYDPAHALLQSDVPLETRRAQAYEFAERKPQLVVDMMREFSNGRYRVDILKVEFSVVAQFVEGSRTFSGRAAYSMNEAIRWYRAADDAAGRPYIYLSAGVSNAEFLESIRLALEAKTRFSGVLCGRATWQDGVSAFVSGGRDAFQDWLRNEGIANIEALNQLIAAATPWHQALGARQAT